MRKHEFALHIATLSALVEEVFPGEEIVISDEKVVHRMLTVLRLQTDDECIVFDHKLHVRFVIKEFIRKKQIRCVMQSQGMNTILSPRITFLLPVLKRDDFEAALYSLTEVGVTTIQ